MARSDELTNFEFLNRMIMKKAIGIFFVVALMIALFSSCRSHETCPAYHNGSAQKAAPAENHGA